MSQIEYHSGRLKKIPIKLDESLKQQCKRIILENNPDFDINMLRENYNGFEDYFREEWYNEYFILNGRIYEVLEHSESEENTFDIWEDPDGTISFAGSFYNGSTDLTEMIEDCLKNL